MKSFDKICNELASIQIYIVNYAKKGQLECKNKRATLYIQNGFTQFSEPKIKIGKSYRVPLEKSYQAQFKKLKHKYLSKIDFPFSKTDLAKTHYLKLDEILKKLILAHDYLELIYSKKPNPKYKIKKYNETKLACSFIDFEIKDIVLYLIDILRLPKIKRNFIEPCNWCNFIHNPNIILQLRTELKFNINVIKDIKKELEYFVNTDNLQLEKNTYQLQKLVWNGQNNVLYDLFRQLKNIAGKDKTSSLIPNSIPEVALFLKNSFTNFETVSLATIETQLKNNKNAANNRPKIEKRIELDCK